MATHIQSGERAAFASFAELEQFIAGWLQPAAAEPGELSSKAGEEIEG